MAANTNKILGRQNAANTVQRDSAFNILPDLASIVQTTTKHYIVRKNAKRDDIQHTAKQGETDANNIMYALVFFWGGAAPSPKPPSCFTFALTEESGEIAC